MSLTITAFEAQSGGSVQEKTLNADLFRPHTHGVNEQPSYVSAEVYGNKYSKTYVFTFNAIPVTLVKNGTSTGGGGTKFWTFPDGLVLPIGGSSNLTIAAAGDKSFLASVGTAAADTGGSLSSTEANVLPSTAATTTSNAGTCKMKSTVSVPAPGTPIDGTSSPVAFYLNSALNADATGVEALTYSGTMTVRVDLLGDN